MVLFILTQTWLNSSIRSQELGFINYDIFRFDRNSVTSEKLRGELIAVNKNLRSLQIQTSLNKLYIVGCY